MSSKEILEKIVEAQSRRIQTGEDVLKNTSIVFIIEDDGESKWHMFVDETGSPVLTEGDRPPEMGKATDVPVGPVKASTYQAKLDLTIDKPNLLAIVKGESNAIMAFLLGKIKIAGSMMAMTRMQKFMGGVCAPPK